MIRFSFSSFHMAFLFSNVMILFLYLIFRKSTRMLRLGIPLLGFALCITVLRMLFPFELLFLSNNIYYPPVLSETISEFLHPRFFHEQLSIWSFVEIIWFAGIIFSALRYWKAEHTFSIYVKENSRKLSETSPACQILKQIQRDFPKVRRIKIRTLSGLQTPAIYGLWHPIILLPESFDLENEQLYYVLRHEVSHYLHHDLTLKFIIKLLRILYWWNPLCYLLQKQADSLLEIRVDHTMAEHHKKEYLSCLLLVAARTTHDGFVSTATNTISFCSQPSELQQRFEIMLSEYTGILHKFQKYILSLFFVSLFCLSYLFIFEASTRFLHDLDSITPAFDNSYFIEREDGQYDFYLEGEYADTVTSLEYYSEDIPIYTKEVLSHEQN